MASNLKDQGNQPSQMLLEKLYRVYGRQPMQRDTFGRRPALASEIAQLLTQAEERSTITSGPDAGGEA